MMKWYLYIDTDMAIYCRLILLINLSVLFILKHVLINFADNYLALEKNCRDIVFQVLRVSSGMSLENGHRAVRRCEASETTFVNVVRRTVVVCECSGKISPLRAAVINYCGVESARCIVAPKCNPVLVSVFLSPGAFCKSPSWSSSDIINLLYWRYKDSRIMRRDYIPSENTCVAKLNICKK